MSEIPRCFAALGFDGMPQTRQELTDQFEAMMDKRKDSTESDRLARQLLRENYDMCRKAMEGA